MRPLTEAKEMSRFAPLLPSRIPTPDELPDNHLSYALQWFAFATTLTVIYAIYVRRWRRERVQLERTRH